MRVGLSRHALSSHTRAANFTELPLRYEEYFGEHFHPNTLENLSERNVYTASKHLT